MTIALDQTWHVMAMLGHEVKDLKAYEPGDPAPYVNLRPWGVLLYITGGPQPGDDPRRAQEDREVERAIKWTLKKLEREGEITIYRDPDGFMAGVWLGQVPQQSRGRRKVAINDREIVMARDGWACVLCDAASDLTIDHIFPVAHGGSDDAINLRVLCRSCNSRKGAVVPSEILRLGREG